MAVHDIPGCGHVQTQREIAYEACKLKSERDSAAPALSVPPLSPLHYAKAHLVSQVTSALNTSASASTTQTFCLLTVRSLPHQQNYPNSSASFECSPCADHLDCLNACFRAGLFEPGRKQLSVLHIAVESVSVAPFLWSHGTTLLKTQNQLSYRMSHHLCLAHFAFFLISKFSITNKLPFISLPLQRIFLKGTTFLKFSLRYCF